VKILSLEKDKIVKEVVVAKKEVLKEKERQWESQKSPTSLINRVYVHKHKWGEAFSLTMQLYFMLMEKLSLANFFKRSIV